MNPKENTRCSGGIRNCNFDFENPALCREDGVLYSYCCICQKYLGNEYDTDWQSLIRRQYCDSCKQKVAAERNAIRQKNFRKRNRAEKKLVKQQNNLLKQENKLLRQMVATLRDDVEKLKKE
ncbi:MAG: hypothetical protein LIO40_06130 [Ruminococcus sp.]|nr:hypothetical protein [Ruminococcus sp.]